MLDNITRWRIDRKATSIIDNKLKTIDGQLKSSLSIPLYADYMKDADLYVLIRKYKMRGYSYEIVGNKLVLRWNND